MEEEGQALRYKFGQEVTKLEWMADRYGYAKGVAGFGNDRE